MATILCFVYVVASSGATIHFHYCMKKFIGWDVAVDAPATCNNCGMVKEKKKGCCNDKHTTLQLKKDQLVPNINYVLNSNIVYIQLDYLSQKSSSLFYKKDVTQPIHIPPLIQPISAYILNNVFRI